MARKQGKVVATIEYRANGHSVDVDLRLVQLGGKFKYIVDHENPPLHLVCDEAEEMRTKVHAELKHLLAITWKTVFVVKTSVSEYESDVNIGNRSISITVDQWEVGTTTTGETVHRRARNPGWPESWVERHRHGLPDEEEGPSDPKDRNAAGDDGQRHEHSVTIIDATPENRARLDAIIKAFDNLGLMLTGLLSPKQIALTLANVKVLGLPFEPTKEKRR